MEWGGWGGVKGVIWGALGEHKGYPWWKGQDLDPQIHLGGVSGVIWGAGAPHRASMGGRNGSPKNTGVGQE